MPQLTLVTEGRARRGTVGDLVGARGTGEHLELWAVAVHVQVPTPVPPPITEQLPPSPEGRGAGSEAPLTMRW